MGASRFIFNRQCKQNSFGSCKSGDAPASLEMPRTPPTPLGYIKVTSWFLGSKNFGNEEKEVSWFDGYTRVTQRL